MYTGAPSTISSRHAARCRRRRSAEPARIVPHTRDARTHSATRGASKMAKPCGSGTDDRDVSVGHAVVLSGAVDGIALAVEPLRGDMARGVIETGAAIRDCETTATAGIRVATAIVASTTNRADLPTTRVPYSGARPATATTSVTTVA